MSPDFITNLARLLSDGRLRDAFGSAPNETAKSLGVREEDIQAFLKLDPRELEVQALVLLKKRFEKVCQVVPRTIQGMNESGSAWRRFQSHGRVRPLNSEIPAWRSAHGFCAELKETCPECVCPLEWHRLEWLRTGGRCSIRRIKQVMFHGKRRNVIHLLARGLSGASIEWVIYLGW